MVRATPQELELIDFPIAAGVTVLYFSRA